VNAQGGLAVPYGIPGTGERFGGYAVGMTEEMKDTTPKAFGVELHLDGKIK